MIRAIALASFLALGSCQTSSGDFCDIASPIRVSSQQVDRLSDAEVTRILAHNRRGQELCGWRR